MRSLLRLIAFVLLHSVFVLPLQAATITVTTLSDNFTSPVAGSLRAAINTANADPANGYIINFNVAGGGTLALAANTAGARMLPILTNPNGISIDGANGGQGAITIDGGATSDTTGDRIFFVGVQAGTPKAGGGTMTDTATTSYSISNLLLQNGNARRGAGGAAAASAGGGGQGWAGQSLSMRGISRSVA